MPAPHSSPISELVFRLASDMDRVDLETTDRFRRLHEYLHKLDAHLVDPDNNERPDVPDLECP